MGDCYFYSHKNNITCKKLYYLFIYLPVYMHVIDICDQYLSVIFCVIDYIGNLEYIWKYEFVFFYYFM